MGVFGGYTGNMDIAEEKREVFATQAMKLLNYGGMMEFEQISMYGHRLGLLKPVQIYPGGKVCFHFNYFEDDAWETAKFDASDCSFRTEKIGSYEFCDVAMAVYCLYELYDREPGAAQINGDIIHSTGYTGWINHLLGTDFSMKKRFRLWDNIEALAFAKLEYGGKTDASDIEAMIPHRLEYAAAGTELADLLYLSKGTETLTEAEVKPGTYPADVLRCKRVLETYFNSSRDGKAVERIWEMLKKDRKNRERTVDSELREAARLSLRLPARVFVYITAELKERDFWKEWKELHESVYHDEIMEKYASDELEEWRRQEREVPIPPVRTSDFLWQEEPFFLSVMEKEEGKERPDYHISDDDRMYWWDGTDEVIISEKMDEWLKELAERHCELSETLVDDGKTGNDFLKGFLSLLVETDRFYKRICPFQTMFYEFIQNGYKKEYRAAIELLRQLTEENKEEGKIIESLQSSWELVSRKITHNTGRLRLKRYLAVMANRKLRQKYFGF